MRIKIILFIVSMSLSSTLFAQQKRITGHVGDAVDGSSIVGATAMVKNSTNGTATDENGEFVLNVSVGDTVVFAMIGKKDVLEIVAEKKNVYSIIMYDDETQLEEVTVVAFGTQKKTSVVSSITTVNAKDLRIPSSNLTNSFAGRIPGIISYQDTGEPGADNAKFFVRGIATFGEKKDPLILIDGFESTTDELARLQPDDIESFSVLKDASATSLYGARGANGIILVNTKAGVEGPVRVSARIDTHIASPTRMLELIGAEEYMRLYNQAQISRNPDRGPYYSEQKIQATARGDDPLIYPNIDWYDILFNKQTVNTKANINLSGGGQVATYYVAGGYENENGLLKVDRKNDFNSNISINRFHLRSNVVFKFGKTTMLDTRIQGRFERYTGPHTDAGTIYKGILNSNPVDFPPVYEPDEARKFSDYILFGSVIPPGSNTPKTNPYAEMVRGYKGRDQTDITAQLTLSQDLDFITRNLKFQGRVSYNNYSSNQSWRTYNPLYFGVEEYDPVAGIYKLMRLNPTAPYPRLGAIGTNRNTTGRFYMEARFNWARTFGLHTVGAMAVGMVEENTDNNGADNIFESLPQRNAGNSGRLSYDYDNRYFAEFSYGLNGSEKFTGKNRYGFFPAFGVGWMVSNESFWEPLKNAVSNFKLKATYGLVGNDAISERHNRFWFLSWIDMGGGGYKWGETFSTQYGGYSIKRYANPDITWELSQKYNFGTEISFFSDASLNITFDVFADHRTQVYMERKSIPQSVGLEPNVKISGNAGKINSKGVDGSIEYKRSFSKDFWMTGRANFTYSTNKLIVRDEEDFTDKYLSQIGQSYNQMQGLVAERLFVDKAEIENSPEQTFGDYEAGDIKYTDINGDGKINNNDRVWMGYPNVPEMQYGFGLSTGYKNFDFSFFFQGNAHVSFFINPGGGEGIAPFIDQRNALAIVANGAWTETNPDVHAFWPRLSTYHINNNTQWSSWWMRNGSLLRLKSVEVGYSLPFSKRLKIETARVYFSTENLLRFSSFKLWDPEMGGEGMAYPLNRRFNVGLQLNF
ncbi:MAG: TonB-dependent receptor [Prevotellaceae bacterium]|jgi:TonB-linked SusC/RagA family outer membrane protein|nr:TonB-dependent receptor [Prevotellaceae bacterium]